MMNTSARLVEPSNGEPNLTSATEDQQSHAATGIDDQTHGNSNRSLRASARKKNESKSNQPCRFFATKNGCRAGNRCRFQHVKPADVTPSDHPGTLTEASNRPNTDIVDATSSPPDTSTRTLIVSHPPSKPVSQKELENPREYQITQVVRRYSPFRADLDDNTVLKFRLSPTDPDFPFELETGLHCLLNVPSGYPQNGRPSLEAQNPEMPKGFQINVEKGFDSLVEQYPGKSLLALLNELDKNLERFLTSAKATTVKFVSHARKEPAGQEYIVPIPPVPAQHTVPKPTIPRYSLDQLRDAKIRRDAEIRQLEARLGRSENFSKAGDGVAFNVPLQIPFSNDTPASLRSLRESALIVPEVYPLEPCTIILRGVDGDEAENVELAFEKRVVSNAQLTLMAHINYLTQNLGKMAVDLRPRPEVVSVADEEDKGSAVVPSTDFKEYDEGIVDPNRPHLKYIARPPEWTTNNHRDSSDETDSSEYESSEDDNEENADSEIESTAGGASLAALSNSGTEKGISISFPNLNLTNIELLELTSLSLTVKCNRCKQTADIKDIKSTNPSTPTTNLRRTETCTKCTAPFTFTFRPELIHTNSVRAGHIDLENCTIVDLLPSTFQPTCSSCSTPFPVPPGTTAVRGDTTLTICRTCHTKMTLQIAQVKFLNVSSTPSGSLPLRTSKKPKDFLGITANTPLPDNGRCAHYSKSYRWFRFSCCATVYPCDKCHDTSPSQKNEPHPNEHADRMICGWCSREQRYHPDTCRFCGRSVVRMVVTSGFWEGGKGTRERGLMRRKEGRKFKRSGREKREVEAARNKRKEGKGRGGMWWPG